MSLNKFVLLTTWFVLSLDDVDSHIQISRLAYVLYLTYPLGGLSLEFRVYAVVLVLVLSFQPWSLAIASPVKII